jgi:hypothetical protein
MKIALSVMNDTPTSVPVMRGRYCIFERATVIAAEPVAHTVRDILKKLHDHPPL